MKNLKILNELILETIQNYNENEIVEINGVDNLLNKIRQTSLVENRKIKMNNRKEIILETMVRKFIRERVRSHYNQIKNNQLQEELVLRKVIRKLLKESDISDIHPHRSTGINVLEDLLKKLVPLIRTDFKKLTTGQSQRKSFRAHIIKAIKDSLLPSLVNDRYLQGQGGEASSLLSEPVGSDLQEDDHPYNEEYILDEVEIELEDELAPGDETKKIPVEDDDTPSDEEQFGTGLEDMDETGRNMAYSTFRKINQYILDSYDSLANPEDKKIFLDYLITNVKLYFDKFEAELAKTVEEPTTDEYERAKKGSV